LTACDRFAIVLVYLIGASMLSNASIGHTVLRR
jgi:hypothetical protein